MKSLLLLAAVGLSLVSFGESMRKQSVAVRGRLHCGAKPSNGTKVKLMEKDTGLDPDDQLDEGYTDANGEFQLQGDETELTTIDPELKIYHDCNKGINPCPRKWVFKIPDLYITNGPVPHKTFDIGDVNLEVEIEGETFDCIH